MIVSVHAQNNQSEEPDKPQAAHPRALRLIFLTDLFKSNNDVPRKSNCDSLIVACTPYAARKDSDAMSRYRIKSFVRVKYMGILLKKIYKKN